MALAVTAYSAFNSMVAPLVQRIADLEAEVANRRRAVIELREHVHEIEVEHGNRLTHLETTEP